MCKLSPEDEQIILFETSRPDRLFSEDTLNPKEILLLNFKNMQNFKHYFTLIEFKLLHVECEEDRNVIKEQGNYQTSYHANKPNQCQPQRNC